MWNAGKFYCKKKKTRVTLHPHLDNLSICQHESVSKLSSNGEGNPGYHMVDHTVTLDLLEFENATKLPITRVISFF